jgi:predicted transcriptional regulator
MPKKNTSVRLDEDLIDALKSVADQQNRTFNNLIETALLTYCKQHENENLI